MQNVVKDLKGNEKELLDVFASHLHKEMVLKKPPAGASAPKTKVMETLKASLKQQIAEKKAMETKEKQDVHYIKHFRQADSIFQFDVEKHMSLTPKEKHMLQQLKKYESI